MTELFLVVENTAQDWGVEQDLMVETITQESLSQWLEKVLKCNCRMDEWMMVDDHLLQTFSHI